MHRAVTPVSFAISVAVLAGISTAQQTHTVGPGGQFTTIAAAIAAAAPGDTVLVGAGTYAESLDINKGISLIGQGTRLEQPLFFTGVVIHDIPAGQTFAMRGFVAHYPSYSLSSSVGIQVSSCAGVVSLRDLGQSNLTQWYVQVTGSNQTHIADAVLEGLITTSSNVVVERCVFDPEILSGLSINGGQVDCALCSIRGSFGVFGGPGLMLNSGRLTLTRSQVEGIGNVTPQPAIWSAGGEVIVDPSTTLKPSTGAAAVVGPATLVTRDLASVTADTDGQQLDIELHGPAGADFVLLVSHPAPLLRGPWGDLWVDPGDHVFVDFGTLSATRLHPVSVKHGPVLPGFAVTFQAVLFAQGFLLSSPSVVVTP